MNNNSNHGPLAGVRVIDLTRYIAGPYASQLLGYLGAEVIKIEEPGTGDPMRGISRFRQNGLSAHFASGNASKKSVTLRLRSDEGRRIFFEMLTHADVVIENFRPGVLARLGVDYPRLREANPRIIFASITGFGQTGPWKAKAAYDLVAQAAGGGMSLTGWPGKPPVKMGVPIGDLGAGVFAALAVVSALYNRQRTQLGESIDLSMLDVQLSLLNYHAHYFWASGKSPEPEGDGHPNVVPYQSFRTATGAIVVAVYGDAFWPGFCKAIAMVVLVDDARFCSNNLRCENKPALIDILEDKFLTCTSAFWLERLDAEGIPTAPLNDVGEALASPQALARNMVVTVTGPDNQEMKLLGNPIKFASGDTTPQAPPLLGQHTAEVLRELLGYDAGRIEELRQAGVI